MAEDRELLRQLKDLREKKAKTVENLKYLIVCDHVIFTLNPITCVFIKANQVHPKDNGKRIMCDGCAFVFENQALKGNPQGFRAIREDELEGIFKKNVKNIEKYE